MPTIASKISVFRESEVKEIIRKAKRVLKHPGLDVLLSQSPNLQPHGRILVITSRKIGPAAKRNLVRRRLKSIFYQEKLYENKLDYICIIKSPGIQIPFLELKKILLDIKNPFKTQNQ